MQITKYFVQFENDQFELVDSDKKVVFAADTIDEIDDFIHSPEFLEV